MLPSPCGVTGSAVPPSGACPRSAVLRGPPGRGPDGSLEGLATWLAPLKHRSGCTALGKRSRGAFADVPPSKPCCAPTWPGTQGASAGMGTVLPQQTGFISIRRMRSPCTPPWQASWPQGAQALWLLGWRCARCSPWSSTAMRLVAPSATRILPGFRVQCCWIGAEAGSGQHQALPSWRLRPGALGEPVGRHRPGVPSTSRVGRWPLTWCDPQVYCKAPLSYPHAG